MEKIKFTICERNKKTVIMNIYFEGEFIGTINPLCDTAMKFINYVEDRNSNIDNKDRLEVIYDIENQVYIEATK